jgi:hypothetical protein
LVPGNAQAGERRHCLLISEAEGLYPTLFYDMNSGPFRAEAFNLLCIEAR